MATYAELHAILTDNVAGNQSQMLREKVGVACFVAVNIISLGTDTATPPWKTGGHDQRVKWANLMLASPAEQTRRVFAVVIAANASATQAQILAASDALIQSHVNAAIDTLAANIL